MIEREVAELRARVAKLEHTVAFLEAHLGVRAPALAAPAGVSARVAALARSGDKMGAIRAHCEETGASLGDAKKLIESLG